MRTGELVFVYCLGSFIRFWLMSSPYQNVIANRIEVSTPVNSWKKVTEGLYLMENGLDPYDGDVVHESPLHMLFYQQLVKLLGSNLLIIFIMCDIVTAHFLYLAAKKYMLQLRGNEVKQYNDRYDDNPMLIISDFEKPPIYVVVAYLFNPYTLFNCVAMTTTVFSNLSLSVFLFGMLKGSVILSAIPLAMSSFQTFYTILLMSPMFVNFYKYKSLKRAVFTSILAIICFGALVLCAGFAWNDWSYLENTFGFVLKAPDLRPNIGLFWYFFIEMFEHFRSLFIYSFQINVCLLYLMPLSIRFRSEPMLLAASLISLIATFKSYPCLGDVGFVLSLLPCWKHLFHFMQQGFLVGCNFLVTTALGPTVWYLWIYSGSANANFYFGVTLAFATAQIFLITDILFAHTKREFTISYGHDRKINGEEAKLVLE